jgi:hypothetical protein
MIKGFSAVSSCKLKHFIALWKLTLLLGLITNPDFLDTFGHPGTGFLGIIGKRHFLSIKLHGDIRANIIWNSFYLQHRLLARLCLEFLLWSPIWTTTSDMDCDGVYYRRRHTTDFSVLSCATHDRKNHNWHGSWNWHFNGTNLVCFHSSLDIFKVISMKLTNNSVRQNFARLIEEDV